MKPSPCFLLTGFIRSVGESVCAPIMAMGFPHYVSGLVVRRNSGDLNRYALTDRPFLADSKGYDSRCIAGQKIFPSRLAYGAPGVSFLRESSITDVRTHSRLANSSRTPYSDLLEAGFDEPLLDLVYGVKGWWKSAGPRASVWIFSGRTCWRSIDEGDEVVGRFGGSIHGGKVGTEWPEPEVGRSDKER